MNLFLFLKQLRFPFTFSNGISFHVSLLPNRLSVGQWVSRLFAFPKIVLPPAIIAQDIAGFWVKRGGPEAPTTLLFLFLMLLRVGVFSGLWCLKRLKSAKKNLGLCKLLLNFVTFRTTFFFF